MKRLAMAVATLLLVQPALAAEPSVLPPGYAHVPVAVAPGVWTLSQPAFWVQPAGNVTLIEQSDGLVLVDAGGSPGAARRIVEQVRALSPKPVKAVVITHWHGDHPQGLDEILKAWPRARTIATRATAQHLTDPKTMNTPSAADAEKDAAFQGQVERFLATVRDLGAEAQTPEERAGWAASERLFAAYGPDMKGALTVPVKESFQDRLLLDDPMTPVELVFLGRANTDGDALAWLPKQRVLITGDIVVSPIPFGFGSYPADWLAVLDKLKAYDFGVLVPGHGPPQRDRAYLERLSGAIADIRAQVASLAASGASREETQLRVDASAQAAAFVGDDPWLRRWFEAYWVAPLVASAWKEAKGQPIVQSLRGE
jgi:glyoxylase-like metal-dependent hydrolase (beta-lactamase superfamily II)